MSRILAAIALAVGVASSALAANRDLVERIIPQVAQRGTTVEVTIEGNYLDAPQDLLRYQDGIEVLGFEPLDIKTDYASGKTSPVDPGTRWRARLRIADDCPLGEHPLRLRTKRSLSEAVPFFVTAYPIVHEANPGLKENDHFAGAQPLELNRSVWGHLPGGPPQDHDFYRVEAKAGERISIEVVGNRLGTWHNAGMNDPALRLLDENGKLLARNDDNSLLVTDPLLSIVAPRDGGYYIDLHQQMDYETIERFYILHVGTWSRPTLTYPLGGPAGKDLDVRILGDSTGERRETIPLPSLAEASPRDISVAGPLGELSQATAEGSYFDFYAATPGNRLPPSPNRLRVVGFANLLEGAPLYVGQIPIALPVAMNGIIDAEDDVDQFHFRALKDEKWFVRVFAAGLGSPLDPRIWITRAKDGKRVSLVGSAGGGGGNQRLADDDATWEGLERVGQSYRHQTQDRLDPQVVFAAPTDGEYILSVTDTRAHFGPSYAYRVEFHAWRDKIFTALPPYPSQPRTTRDRFVVPRGAFYPRNVVLQKGLASSYSGELEVEAIGLPSGVRIHAPRLYPGQTEFLVLLEADADAPLGQAFFDLVVRPVAAGKSTSLLSTFKQTLIRTQRRGDFVMHFSFVEQAPLAVVESPPFRLELDQPAIPIARSGELTLNVRCHRNPGFDGAVYCEMDWLPPEVAKQTPLVIAAGQSEAGYRLNASGGARPGAYKLAITGRQNEGGDIHSGAGLDYVASNFIDLRVDDPYVTIEIARAAVERAKQSQIVCQVAHNRPMPGSAQATLKRLPNGVRVLEPLPSISAGDTEIVFQIEASTDALLGQYKDIVCEVTVVEAGQEIRQQSGSGILRIDPQRGTK